MSATALRRLLREYLGEVVATAGPDTPLAGTSVKKNPFAAIDAAKIVSIGPKESTLAPTGDYSTAEEFGASPVIVIVVPVGGEATEDDYEAAIELAEDMAKQIAADCFINSDLGGRVRDSLPGKLRSDWTEVKRAPVAVANLELHVNVAGQQIGG